jgi:hypothetical protein
MMADASVVAAIGAEAVWRLVPGVWRPWWINPVKAAFTTFNVAEVSLDSLPLSTVCGYDRGKR